MVDKFVPQTPEEMDLSRMAFSGYTGLDDEKPCCIEVLKYKDGGSIELYHGMINPCKFGDQCEGHACYCNHPDGPRKCRRSWYTGGESPDEECELYEPNPYWQDVEGNFYDKRLATMKFMHKQGLCYIEEEEEVGSKTPDWYKNQKKVLQEDLLYLNY